MGFKNFIKHYWLIPILLILLILLFLSLFNQATILIEFIILIKIFTYFIHKKQDSDKFKNENNKNFKKIQSLINKHYLKKLFQILITVIYIYVLFLGVNILFIALFLTNIYEILILAFFGFILISFSFFQLHFLIIEDKGIFEIIPYFWDNLNKQNDKIFKQEVVLIFNELENKIEDFD